ncbi:MAG: thiolase family protein [Sporomusa sp.]
MENCVITSAVRTAVGGYLGSLKTVPAQHLAKLVLQDSLKRSAITPADVDQIIMGEVIGTTPNIARVSALLAGFGEEISAFTVDRQCGSSLQAVVSATHAIKAGEADVIIAGGAESMSRAPYYYPFTSRFEGYKLGHIQGYDAFSYASENAHPPELFPGLNMGLTAENVATKYNITREMQDAFACDSQLKYREAAGEGKFQDEILPVEVQVKKSSFIFNQDEHPKTDTNMEKLGKLKPVFKKDGTVTPGNASGMNDGASAVVVMSETRAKELGCKPLVKIISSSTTGVDPSVMGLGPVPAIQKALAKAKISLDEVGLFELNEAFAAQSLGCLLALGMEPGTELYNRVNVNGGAIAHGHALGNSGTRILTTLIYEMKRRNVKYGVASLCIGGGQGIALVVENCMEN